MEQADPRASRRPDDAEQYADALRAGRAALLDTLAGMLLKELDLELAHRLQADPILGPELRPPEDEPGIAALRSAYARLILLDVPPYSSVYLDTTAMMGGESARRWEALLLAHGLAPDTLERAAAPDHAGLVLRALAAAERDDNVEPILREALRWLPLYLTALERADPNGFYGRVAVVAASVLQECDRASRAPAAVDWNADAVTSPPALPEDDSLRALARWLCTPAASGFYLSKSELRRFATALGVGVGIVDRAVMLQQVFEASGLDGRTPELLEMLLDTCRQWEASLGIWQQELRLWSYILQPWTDRLRQTSGFLEHLYGVSAQPPPAVP